MQLTRCFYERAPRNRDYNYEKKKLTLPRKETSSHPLQQLTVTVSVYVYWHT